jgi:hypothetical protein
MTIKQKTRFTALFPLPGSKFGSAVNRKKFLPLLRPLPHQTQVAEPFMGAAGLSIEYSHLRSTLGDINISQRAIALAPTDFWLARQYERDYTQARDEALKGIDLDDLFAFVGRKTSQTVLKEERIDIYKKLNDQWDVLFDRLYHGIAAGDPMPGLYSFMQRGAFGNVMRMNPNGTAYNVDPHVDKLSGAFKFNPEEWVAWLQSKNWSPRVCGSWQAAIERIKRPENCYLLLDPPYIEDTASRKMTPCYQNHRVTTDEGRAYTYSLAIDPIEIALNKGFPLIHFTNYYSAQLDADVTALAHAADYICDRVTIGICGAMGNSAGRHKHGDRADTRPRPVECLWILRRAEQLIFTFLA